MIEQAGRKNSDQYANELKTSSEKNGEDKRRAVPHLRPTKSKICIGIHPGMPMEASDLSLFRLSTLITCLVSKTLQIVLELRKKASSSS